jgi:hypothetical protein
MALTKYIKAPIAGSMPQYIDSELRKIQAVVNGEYGEFEISLIGCTTVPTAIVKYERRGNIVVMWVPTLRGTSNNTTADLIGVPPQLLPTSPQLNTIFFTNNTMNQIAILITDKAAGALRIGNTLGSFVNWTASGLKGPNNCVLTFLLD